MLDSTPTGFLFVPAGFIKRSHFVNDHMVTFLHFLCTAAKYNIHPVANLVLDCG